MVKQYNITRPKQRTPDNRRVIKLDTGRQVQSRQWQAAARAWVERYPFCVLCLCYGRINERGTSDKLGRRGLVVDHIVPHRGNSQAFWDESNWETLCKGCHDGSKARVEAASGDWHTHLRRIMHEHGASQHVAEFREFIPDHIWQALHA